MSATRSIQKMRELTMEYYIKKFNAVETYDRMREKFGDSAPTLCTIYKWRKEFRGGKGEREVNAEIDLLEEGQKSAKIPRKGMDKYCTPCNREMSSRPYYELHMLKVHDIFLGESKPLMDYLDQLPPSRTQKLIFRCDACFGGAIDYDTIEELQQHKSREHGQPMRMPKWSSVAKMSQHRMKLAAASSSVNTKPAKETLRRDKSLPASGTLRRSSRIPKPSSAIIHSLLLAKDFIEMSETNDGGEVDEQKSPPNNEFPRRGRRIVNFKEENSKEFESNEGLGGNNSEDKQQQQDNINEVSGIGLSAKDDDYEVPFMIKDDPLEIEEQLENEQQQQTNLNNNEKPAIKKRMMSPGALDAANSLLKLTFGSPPTSSPNFSAQNSSTIINDHNGIGKTVVVTTIAPTISNLSPMPSSLTQFVSVTSPPSSLSSAMPQSISVNVGNSSPPSSPTNTITTTQSLEQSEDCQSVVVSNDTPDSDQLESSKNRSITSQKKLLNILKNGNLGNVKLAEKSPTKLREQTLAENNGDERKEESPIIQQKTVELNSTSSSLNNISSNHLQTNESTKTAASSQKKGTMAIAGDGPAEDSPVQSTTSSTITETVINSSTPSASTSILPTIIGGAGASPQTLMILPQDDCTWFAHSIAAQLRMMPTQMKELAKMQMQQVIFECNTVPTAFSQGPTSTTIQQIVQKMQMHLPKLSNIQTNTMASFIGVNGNDIVANGEGMINNGETIKNGDTTIGEESQENSDEIDVVTLEENGSRNLGEGVKEKEAEIGE